VKRAGCASESRLLVRSWSFSKIPAKCPSCRATIMFHIGAAIVWSEIIPISSIAKRIPRLQDSKTLRGSRRRTADTKTSQELVRLEKPLSSILQAVKSASSAAFACVGAIHECLQAYRDLGNASFVKTTSFFFAWRGLIDKKCNLGHKISFNV